MDRQPYDAVDDALGMDEDELRQRANKAREEREKVEWPDPEPLHEPPPPVPAFPVGIMGPWADWCSEQAETVSAPVDYVAMALLTLTGAAIANTRWGSPWEGWREPPVLFTGLVGLPSSGKSPAADVVLDPLRRAERELAEGFDEIHRRWETARAEAEAKREQWEREVKEAVKTGHPALEMPAGAVVPPEPRRPRLFTTEATVEAAAELLANEPKGLAMVRDELAGWIGSMDKYGGNGADRPFWLEAYGGRAKVVDRLKYGGKPLCVPHLSIPVLGGIQPDRLRSMVLAADDDGMAARLCYVWPAPVGLNRPVARPEPERLVAAITDLRRLDMAVDARNGDAFPARIGFSEPAAAALHEFRVRTRAREQDATGVLCGWLGKNPGRVVRIACILEHLWWAWEPRGAAPPEEIGADAAASAIRLAEEYLTPHAERVLEEAGKGSGEAQTAKDAEALAGWIAGQPEPPTLKAAAQFAPTRRLRQKEARDAAMALLVEKSWLRQVRRDGGTVLLLNPGLIVEGA
jgi:hypothetical protein